MCMKHSEEGCLLLERMEKMEADNKVNKALLKLLVGLLLALIAVMSVITFKLLNTQIYLLSGEQGLHAVSDEARGDIQIIRKAVK